MNETTQRPGSIALAAVAIGGVLIAVLPPWSMSIVRLVIATVAATAGLYALGIHAPPAWWVSPFDGPRRRRRRGAGSDEYARIRSGLFRWRQPTAGPALPPDVIRLLGPLVEAAVEREGLDPHDPDAVCSLRDLSPTARAVLGAAVRDRAPWYRLRQPDAGAVAMAVHAVLDDLDRLADGSGGRRQHIDTQHPRTT